MRSITKVLFSFFCLYRLITAQSYDLTMEKTTSYKDWGTKWDTIYVIKNDLITIAVAPGIGGRVMQYDLGTHPSIYVHNGSKNKTINDGNMVVGGFRTLPSPQSDFGWPSPPKLDWAPYTCTVASSNPDSVVLYLEGQIEDSNLDKYKTHKGLQFKRLITLYKASTRVKVEMTMLNKGTSTVKHGIWDITQSTCTNNNAADLQNIWVYFQRNPSSTLGQGKGYVQYTNEGTDKTQWKPDAAPGGIMGVQFLQKTGKIGADCKSGWICFVDQLDGYAYVKTFSYEKDKEYPDSGASVQVYTYSNLNMLEVEVLGPLTTLAKEDSVKMIENWYATRASGPVLAVNSAGLITKQLTAQQSEDTITINGTYGLFYPGKIKIAYTYGLISAKMDIVDSIAVTPMDSLRLNKKYKLPPDATKLHLIAYDLKGKTRGTLDTVAVPSPVNVNNGTRFTTSTIKKVSLSRKHNLLNFTLNDNGPFTISILDINGKLHYTQKTASKSVCITLKENSSKVYMVRVTGSGWVESIMVPSVYSE